MKLFDRNFQEVMRLIISKYSKNICKSFSECILLRSFRLKFRPFVGYLKFLLSIWNKKMVIIWLSFTIVCIKAASDCYIYQYFKNRDESSLARGKMIRLSRQECQALSSKVKKRDCKLHHFLPTKCSTPENKNQEIVLRKQSGKCYY